MKNAYYCDKYGYLEYWSTYKDFTLVDCKTIFNAEKLIRMSGIPQKINKIGA